MAEETIASSAGDNRACSDRRSREDKCSSGKGSRARTGSGGSSKIGSLCNGGRQEEKLLCLRRFWAYGLPLQEQEKREADGRKEGGV